MAVSTTQAQFLGNSRNKSRLIDLLAIHLGEAGLNVLKAAADADTLIVNSAIAIANDTLSAGNVVVVGEDTDLLVLLIALAPPQRDILLLKPGTAKVNTKIYSSSNLQQELGDMCPHLLFAHGMSGCDTTSAPYSKGKKKVFGLLENDLKLRHTVAIFNDCQSSPEEIASAGETFLLSLYGTGKGVNSLNTLDELRYFMYHRLISKQGLNNNFQLAALPPTSAAAKQHSFRVFHQVQLWRGVHLPETGWGWKLVCGNNLFPIATEEPVAPDFLLKLIFCSCKAGCSKACRCRKAGLSCTAMCGHCRGLSCTNCADTLTSFEDDDIFDDIGTNWNDDGVLYSGMEIIVD
jgi:hypothetical protein